MASGAHCHKDIAKVAKELAATSYGELMSFDPLYKAWKAQNPGITDPKRLERAYVTRKWGLYVEAARTTLALLLRQPIDEDQKERIMEILILDKSLVRGRVNGQQIAGLVNNKN